MYGLQPHTRPSDVTKCYTRPTFDKQQLGQFVGLFVSLACRRSSMSPSRRADFPAPASWQRLCTDRPCFPMSAAWIGH